MSQRAQGNIRVDGFGYVLGETTRRLDFPRADIDGLRGEAGSVEYGAGELSFDHLSGRLQGLDWRTEAATAGRMWARHKEGHFELGAARVDLPRGVRITRAAAGGVEIVAPHASLTDVTLHVPDLSVLRRRKPDGDAPAVGGSAAADAVAAVATTIGAAPAGVPPLRQERLRFLDAIRGSLALTIKIVLDLPVLGARTLDQTVKVDLEDGAFDYKKLDDGLTWLEGAFLDIGLDGGRFRIGYRVPLLGTKDIVWFALDRDASAVAAFDRIPLRALADFRTPGRTRANADREKDKGGGRGRLRSLSVSDVAIALHMVAPHDLEAAGGTIRFGGDDAPGIVDLEIAGAVAEPGGGQVTARAGALDLTLKDLHLGKARLTADRLHVDAMDQLTVEFDGFRPRSLTAAFHRVTATNLALTI